MWSLKLSWRSFSIGRISVKGLTLSNIPNTDTNGQLEAMDTKPARNAEPAATPTRIASYATFAKKKRWRTTPWFASVALQNSKHDVFRQTGLTILLSNILKENLIAILIICEESHEIVSDKTKKKKSASTKAALEPPATEQSPEAPALVGTTTTLNTAPYATECR